MNTDRLVEDSFLEGLMTEQKDVFPRKLRLVPEKKIFAGVCAGLAYSLGVEMWIIRFLVILLAMFDLGATLITYLVAMWIVPTWEETPADFDTVTGD